MGVAIYLSDELKDKSTHLAYSTGFTAEKTFRLRLNFSPLMETTREEKRQSLKEFPLLLKVLEKKAEEHLREIETVRAEIREQMKDF